MAGEIPQTDNFFKYFVHDLASRSERNGIFYLQDETTNTRVALHECIANCHLFRKSEKLDSRWQGVFNRMERLNQLEF